MDVYNELEEEPFVDYTALPDGAALLNNLEDNGMKWATAYCQYAKKHLGIDIDLDFTFGWFANAIEHSNAVRRWRKEKEDSATVHDTLDS